MGFVNHMQPVILGMQILVIAKFLIAGVKIPRQCCSHLSCSCACSLGIHAELSEIAYSIGQTMN